jgi:glycine cleavage system aminomethyltransferase T
MGAGRGRRAESARDARCGDPEGLDLSNEAFPYLAVGAVRSRRRAGRLFRISFSGELAYELAVPSSHGEHGRAILQAGALRHRALWHRGAGVMRIEKGHVAGNELNGQTTAPISAWAG